MTKKKSWMPSWLVSPIEPHMGCPPQQSVCIDQYKYRGSCLQRDVDHGGDDRGGVGRADPPIYGPLVNNQKIHIPEKKNQEDQLRHKLKEEVYISTEMQCIWGFDEDTQGHVYDSNDNWYFHFEGVDEVEIVLGYWPDWVQAEGVNAIVSSWNWRFFLNAFRIVARPKQI